MALENYDAAVADFAAAVQEAPGGSAEERAMRSEHRQAEVALKRSKTVDRRTLMRTMYRCDNSLMFVSLPPFMRV